jgi:nucleoside-diphosphate-sugar epimerase
MTPQLTVMEPSTVYGISKLAGERWCEYYHKRYNIDIRSVRYPGLISYKTEPGGGTTDWAVEIYFEAVRNKFYTSFISEDTALPMMFMDDAISATIRLMETDKANLACHSSYNLSGPSLSPRQVAMDIRKYIPGFDIIYKPDFRQAIAESWPQSIEDSELRNSIIWKPKYDLPQITRRMLTEIKNKETVTVKN